MINKKLEMFKEGVQYSVISLIIILGYYVLGKIGLSIAYLNDSASPVWFATGFSILVILIGGYRFWPSIFIGAFLVNITITPSISVSLGIALGNMLEAILATFLINKYAHGKDVFTRVKSSLTFFAIIFGATLASVGFGVGSLILGGFINQGTIWVTAFTWWIGDVIGALKIVPLIIALYHKKPIAIEKERYLEILLAFLLLIILSLIIFTSWPIAIGNSLSLVFLIIPPIIWIAFRSCLRFTTLAVFISSLIAVIGTVSKLSIFNIDSLNIALVLLQIFIGTITITGILISVAIIDYKRKIESLKKRR